MANYNDMLKYSPTVLDKTRELTEKKRTHKELLFEFYKLYIDHAMTELGAKGVDEEEPDKPCPNCAMAFAGLYLFKFLENSDEELREVYQALADDLDEGKDNDEAEQLSFPV